MARSEATRSERRYASHSATFALTRGVASAARTPAHVCPGGAFLLLDAFAGF